MCKAYSYVRFSSDQQADGDSQRRQSDVSAFCQQHNLTLDSLTYQDLGVSAFRGKNKDEGALAAFLDGVKKGRIKKGSVLIVEQLDRLTRIEPDEAIALFSKILRSGVCIGHLRKNRILDKSCLKGFGIMEFVAELILANEESEKKSERVRGALAQNQNRAKTGKIWTSKGPSWLKLSDDRSHWIVIEEQKAKVQRIFKLSKTMGVEAIAKQLTKEGVKPLNGKRWNRNYIRNLLRSKTVLGEYQPTTGKERKPVGDPIQGYYTPIIDEATFYEAQAALDSRVRHRGPTSKFVNILGGLVKDKATGSTMYLASKPQRDGSIKKSLYPSDAINGTGKYWSVDLELVEKAILASVNEVVLTSDQSEEEKQLEGLKAKLQTITARIDQTTDTIDETPDFGAAMKVLQKLEETKNDTETAIEQLEAELSNKPEDTLSASREAITALESASEAELPTVRLMLRSRLRSLIDKIVAEKEGDIVALYISYKGLPKSKTVTIKPKDRQFTLLHVYGDKPAPRSKQGEIIWQDC